MGKNLEIKIARNGSSAVVKIDGSVDSKSSRELVDAIREMLRKGEQERVILDFARAGSIDSAGIAGLVEVLYEAKTRNARLILSGLNEAAREALALTLLNRVFEITGTVEEALR